ncbi:hypothetical protein CHS0354_000564 [Potamilus streckersoni]|uniref:Excinuclease ABC subunit C n=1 Tax=Potamilus streckersoni TaxID=2493646 RepID=A0AAE0T765_9BIVA|nr:hypothetical protein CHS0354_000564 [Potamilus streckersoni]
MNVTQRIKQMATHVIGFDSVGIIEAKRLEPEAARLEAWINKGFHGEMAYMANHFEKRIDPSLLVPHAKTIIVLTAAYSPKPHNFLGIARYAQGKDYHHVLKSKLKMLFEFILNEIGSVNGRAFVDSAPLMEKALAVRAGLGWQGKNVVNHCGTCTACIDACPTHAIVEPAVIDATKCISYLTIELKQPGVYQFLDFNEKIIYVGKAKNLRHRVRSYFQSRVGIQSAKTQALISKISDVRIIKTTSEVEALILENNLIKQFKPRYNINLKDDKSYPYIVITKERFPRVFSTRNTNRSNASEYFGPYTESGQMRIALQAISDIFQVRSCSLNLTQNNIDKKKFKVCLDYHIKKCEGPCEGLQSESNYNLMIHEIRKLLKGKIRDVSQSIEIRMKKLAEEQRFEDAAILKKQLEALKRFAERQKIVSQEKIDRDVFAVATSNDDGCGVIFKIRDGIMIGSERFYFSNILDEPLSYVLTKLLENYYTLTKEITFPDEIFLQHPLTEEQQTTIELLLSSQQSKSDNVKSPQFVFPQIGEKAKLVNMCLDNATFLLNEYMLQKQKRGEIMSVPRSVHSLQRDLYLSSPPLRIECFDNSNLQGSDPVASMVCFVNGVPRKSDYRKFKIKTVQGINDFASMAEIIERRYTGSLSKELPLPDLIVVDGGKGQLSSAHEVLQKHNINIPIIGLAKRLEEVFFPKRSLSFNLPKTSSSLKLLQHIRDEAHRFALTFHRLLRSKHATRSELDEIKGVGEKTLVKLLTHFGTIDSIKTASLNEIALQSNLKVATRIVEHFKQKKLFENTDIPSNSLV